jgi:CubicO group peptidase (beta-lactamase class C family)
VPSFPPQPAGVPWPTETWPAAPPAADVDTDALQRAVDRLMSQPPEFGITLALAVVHRGLLVAEAYGPDTDEHTTLISWSMAKSIVHALAGILVTDGRLMLDEPAAVAEWAADDRSRITPRHLLAMTPGLRFVEDYVDAGTSHCIDMLFGGGQSDVAGYAAALPLDHPPGTSWNYSSGTTNIVSRILGDLVGGGAGGMRAFMAERLFEPLSMRSAEPRFDATGTFLGSSFVYATARDFARFGYLYLRGGQWATERLLPETWVEYGRTPVPVVPDDEDFGYGAHWWLWRDQPGLFGAHGYEGQYTLVDPARDLVVVRLGKTPAELRPNLVDELRTIIGAVPAPASQSHGSAARID